MATEITEYGTRNSGRHGTRRAFPENRSWIGILGLLLVFAAVTLPFPALGQESAPDTAAPERPGLSSLQKSLILPGWGQLAEKRYVEGIAFLAAEAVCLVGILSYNHSANTSYAQYQSATSRDDAVRFRALTEKYDARRNRVLLAAAAVWIVNLVDIYAIVKKNEKDRGTLRVSLQSGPDSGVALALSYRR